jgi:predicted ArsR family transcriptional regulator
MPKSNDDQVLDILAERLQKIEKALVGEQAEDGIRKSKTKDEIVNMLRQHKKLTSTQLGMLLGLSRTRCNEYFRELMKDGRVEGVIVDRQKFYKLVKE